MENKAFTQALSNFVSDVAYKKAIEHLYNKGCSVPEIQKHLSYPVSEDKIREVIEQYEKEKNDPDAKYTFIEDTDAYGRKSFRRVKKE